ncbi:MAG: T9SS type A sorting domain-containing protein [Bacteroidota bacterium]
MKRLNFFLLIFVGSLQWLSAQNIERNLTLVEIVTGTWCYFCPGSAWGADDLVENGHNVAILEYHGGDIFENLDSEARIDYYLANSYPTIRFNGRNEIVGGSNTSSSYPNYLSTLNSIDTASADFRLEMDLTPGSQNTMEVKVKLTKLTHDPTPNLRLHLALTESHISHNWFSLDEVNFVVQKMYPNAMGTSLGLNNLGDTASVQYSIAVDSSWNIGHFELVAFLQNELSNKIYNGQKRGLRAAIHPHDASISAINTDFDKSFCADDFGPHIEITNWGLDPLTTAEIVYTINGGVPSIYQWTGFVETYEKASVQLPAISFTTQESNSLVVKIQSPNGQVDPNISDNSKLLNWEGLFSVEGQHALYLKLDNLGTQTTWVLKGPFGLIATGGPYAFMDTVLKTIPVDIQNYGVHETECYALEFYDSAGNGMTWDFDGTPGYYYLINPVGDTVVKSDGNFTDFEVSNFTLKWATDVEAELAMDAIQVFPNPAQEQINIKITERSAQQYQWKLIDIQGRIILTGNENRSEFSLDLSNQVSGLYQLLIESESGIWTEKIYKR